MKKRIFEARRRHKATAVPRKTAKFAARRLSDELLLLPVRRSITGGIQVFHLNRSAAWLYRRMNGKRSLGELAHELSSSFSVTYRKALADVTGLCRELAAVGAVRSRDGKDDAPTWP